MRSDKRYGLVVALVCLLITGAAQGQNCPSNQWCQIYGQTGHAQPVQFDANGYNRMFYADYGDGTGNAYLYGNDDGANNLVQNFCITCQVNWGTPEGNAFWKYIYQTSVPSSNPWVEVSTDGANQDTRSRDSLFVLHANINATDTTATFDTGQDGLGVINSAATIVPQSCQNQTWDGLQSTLHSTPCTWFIGDEAVTYSSADALTLENMTGTVTVDGSTNRVTWVSGSKFTTSGEGMKNYAIQINGVLYTVVGSPKNTSTVLYVDSIPSPGGTYGYTTNICPAGNSNANEPPPCPGFAGRATMRFRLNGLMRGQRQAAGWSTAASHLGGTGGPSGIGTAAGLLAPNPLLNVNGTMTPITDHVDARHSVGHPVYDANRGKIWVAWGFNERWTLQSTYWLCVHATGSVSDPNNPTAKCATADLTTGWHRVANLENGGNVPLGYQEGVTVYDPVGDALFEFGGLHSGSTADQWVFCFTNSSTHFGCPGNAHNRTAVPLKWAKITAADGYPGQRDAPRAAYDSVNNKIVVMGGMICSNSDAADPTKCGSGGPQINTATMAVFDPQSGIWCISDLTQPWPTNGGAPPSNAASCPTAFASVHGTPPPTSNTSNQLRYRWPSFDFDAKPGSYGYGKGIFWDTDFFYFYDAAANSWSRETPDGGNCDHSLKNCPDVNAGTSQPHSSMVYDPNHDTLYYVETGTTKPSFWQVPLGALGTSDIDITPPMVAITNPRNHSVISGTIVITAEASDPDDAVAGVQFKLDGVNLGAEITVAPYQYTWDTTTTSDGAHALTASARDTHGNNATSAVINVTVSNVSPSSPSISGSGTIKGAGTVAVGR